MMHIECKCGKKSKHDCINKACGTCCHKKLEENNFIIICLEHSVLKCKTCKKKRVLCENNLCDNCCYETKCEEHIRCDCKKLLSNKECKYKKCKSCCNSLDCKKHPPKCKCEKECGTHNNKCNKKVKKNCKFSKCNMCCNNIDCSVHELRCKCDLLKKKKITNDCDNKQCDACCYDKDCDYHREIYVKKRDKIIEDYKKTKLDCDTDEHLEIYETLISKIISIKELGNQIFEFIDERKKCLLCGESWNEYEDRLFYTCDECYDYFCDECCEPNEPFVLCDIKNCYYS